MTDDLWAEIIGEMQSRRTKGIAQYGKPVTADPDHDWLGELSAELLDGIVYARAAKEVLEKQRRRIRDLEQALAEAVEFVAPSVTDTLTVWNDLDGLEVQLRRKVQDIRETRERLKKVLEGQ